MQVIRWPRPEKRTPVAAATVTGAYLATLSSVRPEDHSTFAAQIIGITFAAPLLLAAFTGAAS